MKRKILILFGFVLLTNLLNAEENKSENLNSTDDKSVRVLHFVQDDAQDYMVSKIFILKYAQSNDVAPFLTSIVKRYNMNSNVAPIAYGKYNQQILTVTCPVKMMPYVEDFLHKVDVNIEIDGKMPNDIIKGTGITRAIYRPKYRSGQILVDIIVNAFLNGGPYSSVYGYDANSNQIYWKDNTSNTDFVYQFLGFLDRPAPQINLTFTIYEVRESTLRDLGIDYIAWKNGPGLNLFAAGYKAFDITGNATAAITGATGGLGGFFFAPQFDASFIRILQQKGKANIENSATLSVANSDSLTYNISFNPQLQNIIKSNNDQTSVTNSTVSSQSIDQISMEIIKPIVCLNQSDTIAFEVPNYESGDYAKIHKGTLFFGYEIEAANVVDRNNYGDELVETSTISGDLTIALNHEKIIASWDKLEEVEQYVGMPFLSEIPILRYIFGTNTTVTEKTNFYMTVKAEMLNTNVDFELDKVGVLTKLK